MQLSLNDARNARKLKKQEISHEPAQVRNPDELNKFLSPKPI